MQSTSVLLYLFF